MGFWVKAMLRRLGQLPLLGLFGALLLLACSSSQSPTPAIGSFSATRTPVSAGSDTLITAVFTNGSGTVDGGVGAVNSGVPVSTGPLQADKTFTLTVAGEGSSVQRSLTVHVVDQAAAPVINLASAITVGASASASVVPQVDCTYTWTISGGTLTSSAQGSSVTFLAGSAGYVQLSCVGSNALGAMSSPGWAIAQIVSGPTTPVITAPAYVASGQTGCVASVPAQDGCTFAWQITGGTLTGGAAGCSTTFTAGPSGTVTLTCVASNAAGTESVPVRVTTVVEATPPAPRIVTAASLAAGATATASIVGQSDCVYTWTISGGTFTGGRQGNAVSFTVNPATPLVLTCTATNMVGVSGPAGSVSVPVSFSNDNVLTALSLNSGTPARKGADGRDLTDNDQPLGHPVSNLHQVMNLFELDVQNGMSLLAGDASDTYTRQNMPSADALASYSIRIPVAANLNGDGKQQVVLVCLPGPSATNDHIGIFELTGGETCVLTFIRTLAFPTPHTFDPASTRDWYNKFSVAAADLSGAGHDDIVIAADGNLFVLDNTLAPVTLSTTDSSVVPLGYNQLLRVECADLDHDGKAEIILVNGSYDSGTAAQVSIYRFAATGTGTGAFTHLLDGVPLTLAGVSLRSANVKAGDLVADGYVEVVLCGMRADTSTIRTMVMQVSVANGTWTSTVLPVYVDEDLYSTREAWSSGWETAATYDSCIPVLALGDLDGDGIMEIVADTDVLEYTAATSSDAAKLAYAYDSTSHHALWADVVYCWASSGWANRRKDTATYTQGFVGLCNPSPNAQNEIFILDQNGEFIRRYAYNATTKEIQRGADIQLNGSVSYQFLCLADLTANRTIVQYVGHTLTFTKPIVSAVLVSPPYWDDIQQTGNSLTEFGKSQGASAGVGASIGFSESAMVGTKITIPVVSNGEVEIKATQTTSWDFAFDLTTGYTRNIAYDTYAGTNAVLFAAVPIDIYDYLVIEAGTGAQVHVGDHVYIKKERPAQLQFTDVNFYNANCGDNPKIGTSILPMTLGRPHTYPTRAEAASLVAIDPVQGFLLSNAQCGIVPEGNLYNSMSYSTSLTTGTSVTFESEATLEAQVSLVLLAGGSYSQRFSFNIQTEIDLGTSIMGSVGGLGAESYSGDTTFQWGIFSYPASLGPGAAKVKVISYWVQ